MPRRPCWVEISTSAFEHNYRLLTAACGAEQPAPDMPGPDTHASVDLLAIVKADAYGHSLALCAPAALRAGATWLGVTSVEEGESARALCEQAGSTAEILVIGGVFPGQAEAAIRSRLTPVVWESWHLDELAAAARTSAFPLPVHLELDTGMSRQGVDPASLDTVLSRLKQAAQAGQLRLDGVMTHLYAADESDATATHEQFEALDRMLERIAQTGLLPANRASNKAWLHVGNSAAVLGTEAITRLKEISQRRNMRPMARPGLALYGLAPQFIPALPSPTQAPKAAEISLRPVLTWKTRIVSVRSIAPGQVVGYNGTFVASEPMRVALLAVGYADGLKRALSNRGAVLIAGVRCPIVGRISMDQAVVDITEVPTAAPGDEAVLIGHQAGQAITAEDHAAWAGTVPWEIFTSITARVERIQV